MNILIFAANWYNRGDEAAIRAMLDEIRVKNPEWKIKIHFNQPVFSFPYSDIEVLQPFERLDGKNIIKTILYRCSIRCGGIIPYVGRNYVAYNAFVDAVKWADYAVYAPGGPCIGDLYKIRKTILDILELLEVNKVPYSFFAPSMGPFTKDKERIKRFIKNARIVCLREAISKDYLDALLPDNHAIVTLDSAFQHSIDVLENQDKLLNYQQLQDFISSHDKIIGITITDLKWHRKYCDGSMESRINTTFNLFISYLIENGYGVIFIPQLFGAANDKDYMSSFMINNCFIIDDNEDTYFQQYVISKLYAVVGMRYHSNIFSAKMSIPFISIAYEQKMKGFMQKAELTDYCIGIEDLNFDDLKNRFEKMVKNHDVYQSILSEKSQIFMEESRKTLQLISDDIKLYYQK